MKEITNKDVCIVIPIYKDNINNKLTEDEIDSIMNTIHLMKNYDIYFLCNENLNTLWYKKIKSNSQPNIYFKYYNFRNRDEYSDMCLDYNFYKMFYDHEYMLICQTDAWIFKDELLYWCNKGYDYIGAPVIIEKTHDLINFFNKYLNYDYNNIQINGHINGHIFYNGGFSLRNIKSLYKICFEHQNIIFKYSLGFKLPEDMCISYVLNKYLKLATVKYAGCFALEQYFGKDLYNKYFRNDTPFGCHHINIKNIIINDYKWEK